MTWCLLLNPLTSFLSLVPLYQGVPFWPDSHCSSAWFSLLSSRLPFSSLPGLSLNMPSGFSDQSKLSCHPVVWSSLNFFSFEGVSVGSVIQSLMNTRLVVSRWYTPLGWLWFFACIYTDPIHPVFVPFVCCLPELECVSLGQGFNVCWMLGQGYNVCL